MKTDLQISIRQNAHVGLQGPSALPFWKREITFRKLLTDKLKERFYHDMYVLISAGMDIRAAMDLFHSEVEKVPVKTYFEKLTEDVVKGLSLSEAMELRNEFSKYESVSIRIGEETGNILAIFKELSIHFNRRITLKRQMVKVFSYPGFLLFVTFGVLFFMLNNVVPMFADVFKRFGKELPSFTQSVINASVLVQKYGLIIFILLATTIFVLFLLRKKEKFRSFFSVILLKIPVFGIMVQKVYLSRFCQSMQLMIAARIPLIEALGLVEKMIGFYPIEKALRKIKIEITQGRSLNQGMSEFPIFEKRMVSLIKVSEEVNTLDVMFERLAKQYNDEVEYRTSILGSLIEPVMILLIGIIVGVILIAMYQPLFNINNILE